MIATTLRTGALTLLSVQYKFELNRLTVRLNTDGAHKLYGNVKITLANVQNINITLLNQDNFTANYFNNTFEFKRVDTDTLEFSVQAKSGIAESSSFITLPNNGTAITATVANSFIDLPMGSYNFLLADTTDSEFSTSSISIKQINIGFIGLDGEEATLWGEEDLTADPKKYSINNADLSFDYPARVSIKNNDPNVTNIPLIIT
jgi:hypothetical protein